MFKINDEILMNHKREIILFRNQKSEIILLPTGEVEKKYLKGSVVRDQRNITYLMQHFYPFVYNGWEIRTINIIWCAIDKKSIGIEYIPGIPIVKLKVNALKEAEYLAGIWLFHYQKTIMNNKDYGPLYGDFNLTNCIVDSDRKRFIVIDPGRLFGRQGSIFINIFEHIYSIFACSIKNRYNPLFLVKPFLKGFLSLRREKIYLANIYKAFYPTKKQMFQDIFKHHPYKSIVFLCVTLMLIPIYLLYVPLYLRFGTSNDK
jgi:hypothetical protein